MARIALPEGSGEETDRLWQLAPEIGEAGDAWGRVVREHVTLSVREREAARMRIATINGCRICQETRIAGADEWGIDDGFYAAVDDPARRDVFSERERLAIEFAERFDAGARTFDDAFWASLRAAFSDAELVELAASVAKWLALGRINAVFELSVSCPLVLELGRPAPV